MIKLKELMDNVRAKTPLVHNITNYVTVNDCANILLACGASPIMSDEEEDVSDITSICGGLNINIGTLNKNTIPSMFIAGRRSNELGHPVLLDPAGAGASAIRTGTASRLIDELSLAVIRGNISEIKALSQGSNTTKGVDADAADQVNESNIDSVTAFVSGFAKKTGAVVAVTGATDIITDGDRICCIKNGDPLMSRVTGTGCMLSAMTTAYVVANPDSVYEAVCAAIMAMGQAGETAKARLSEMDGNASYRNYIIDAICNMSGEQLERGAKYELR